MTSKRQKEICDCTRIIGFLPAFGSPRNPVDLGAIVYQLPMFNPIEQSSFSHRRRPRSTSNDTRMSARLLTAQWSCLEHQKPHQAVILSNERGCKA